MVGERCSVCDGELQFRREGSVQGLYCTSCDWSVVTSHIPEIDLDETVYQVSVSGGDPQSLVQVRAVAEVAAVNFLAARKMLLESHLQIMQGDARKVLVARQKLSEAGLKVDIVPDFVYQAP